jgi:hypothetical protein
VLAVSRKYRCASAVDDYGEVLDRAQNGAWFPCPSKAIEAFVVRSNELQEAL